MRRWRASMRAMTTEAEEEVAVGGGTGGGASELLMLVERPPGGGGVQTRRRWRSRSGARRAIAAGTRGLAHFRTAEDTCGGRAR